MFHIQIFPQGHADQEDQCPLGGLGGRVVLSDLAVQVVPFDPLDLADPGPPLSLSGKTTSRVLEMRAVIQSMEVNKSKPSGQIYLSLLSHWTSRALSEKIRKTQTRTTHTVRQKNDFINQNASTSCK